MTGGEVTGGAGRRDDGRGGRGAEVTGGEGKVIKPLLPLLGLLLIHF